MLDRYQALAVFPLDALRSGSYDRATPEGTQRALEPCDWIAARSGSANQPVQDLFHEQ